MTRYNNVKIESLELNKKYTMIGVSDFMANTQRLEFVLKEQRILERYAQYSNVLELVIQPKGKRKLFLIKINDSSAIFEDWNIPLKLDTESTEGSFIMRMNALINIKGETETDKENIRNIFNLNLNSTFKKGLILMINSEEKEVFVFPDDAEKIRYEHAVIDRNLGKQELKELNEGV